ncbi:O-antigen ligase family protein, partial [Pseudomonas sp. 5S4]
TDFNVSSRLDEYRIAWKMFLSHPFLGNGLGAKHEMRWETSEGVSFTQFVAYVHNWPLYILMVGGGVGLLIYGLVLLGPALFRLSSIRSESSHWTVIRVTILTMVVYGLFFAVFRLITFNLLLAAAWGTVFSQLLTRHQKTQGSVNNDNNSGRILHPVEAVLPGSESVNQKNAGASL